MDSSGERFPSFAAPARKDGSAGFRAHAVPETVLVLPFAVADAYVYFHIQIVSSKATEFRPARCENKGRIYTILSIRATLFGPPGGYDRFNTPPGMKFSDHLDFAWVQDFL